MTQKLPRTALFWSEGVYDAKLDNDDPRCDTMIYKWEELIPSKTAEADAVEWSLEITKGVIKRCWVFFPWGCANYAHIQVLRGPDQIFPYTRGEWLGGNDILHEFGENYEVKAEPLHLTIKGYNDDDTYDHTPWVIVQVERPTMPSWVDVLLARLGMG